MTPRVPTARKPSPASRSTPQPARAPGYFEAIAHLGGSRCLVASARPLTQSIAYRQQTAQQWLTCANLPAPTAQ